MIRKSREHIFSLIQVREHFENENFETKLSIKEKREWSLFKNVCWILLTLENWKSLVYPNLVRRSIAICHSHLEVFHSNLAVSYEPAK